MKRQLENRFSKAAKNQRKLTRQELFQDVMLAERLGADKFIEDSFSVYLKNNGINKEQYKLRGLVVQGGK
jgi:hypothetical protein